MTEPLRVITKTESWKQEVNQSIIERLEYALDMAKRGELEWVAIVGGTRDDMVYHSYSSTDNRSEMLGTLERLKYNILVSMNDE